MDTLEDGNKDAKANQPSPEEFDQFLFWACLRLQLNVNLDIVSVLSKFANADRNIKSKASSGKSKPKKSSSEVLTAQANSSISSLLKPIERNFNTVRLYTVYDNAGNLTQLKFDRNKNVPRQVLQIVGLISQFHKFLSGITINEGLNRGCLHELNNLTSQANITDICLDNTCIEDGSYDILLEKSSNLKYLSIARCNINDDTVNRIASQLHHPTPAAHTLSLLNLASNFVSDIGAKYLALALKTNRTLVYLNLSDNSITDDGANAILDVLIEFSVSKEEVNEGKLRHIHYLKEKKKIVDEIILKFKTEEYEKKKLLKHSMKPLTGANSISTNFPPKKTLEGKKFEHHRMDSANAVFLEKAELLAATKLGEFKEPYLPENMVTRDGVTYCKGNNQLAYFNLSYNNIAYLTIKKIVKVLQYQNVMNRKPRGLVNIYIEGNCIPSECPELEQIDSILASYLTKQPKRAPNLAKKLA